jgi:hypothetical protein
VAARSGRDGESRSGTKNLLGLAASDSSYILAYWACTYGLLFIGPGQRVVGAAGKR